MRTEHCVVITWNYHKFQWRPQYGHPAEGPVLRALRALLQVVGVVSVSYGHGLDRVCGSGAVGFLSDKDR